MTFKNFNSLTESVFDKIREIANTKGKEYANDETDRLANFKDIAKEIGISPLQVLLVYSKKHSRAIDNYCKSGGVSHSNESIESRILDRIVYDFLLLGLVEDIRAEKGQDKGSIYSEVAKPHECVHSWNNCAGGGSICYLCGERAK